MATSEISEAVELRRLRWLARNGVNRFLDAVHENMIDADLVYEALASHGLRRERFATVREAEAALARIIDGTIREVLGGQSTAANMPPASVEYIARLMRDGGPWDAA